MERVLCVKRNDLPGKWVTKKSVVKIKEQTFFEKCSQLKFGFQERQIVEQDKNFKQLIPYVLIQTRDLKKIAVYKREGSEKRLHDLWSIGIGGHINPIDAIKNPSLLNEIIITGMKREIDEELKQINQNDEPIFKGIINEDETDVGSVHIGLVFTILTDNKDDYVGGEELVDFRWISTDRLNTMNLELWSKLALKLISK